MILGIGVDMVDIERFKDWHTKPIQQLENIFTPAEIAYALDNTLLSAERFAVRFAAREAFYKALCSWKQPHLPPFVTVCRAMGVAKTPENVPYLTVNWQALTVPFEPICMLSLTHTKTTALAYVTLSAPY